MIRNLPALATGAGGPLALLFLAALSATPRKAWPLTPAEESLASAERAFAASSLASGVRAAFLAHLADDGIVFRPGPVKGKEWLADRPGMANALAWEPGYVEVSRSGDLGLSTGPWEIREGGPDGPPVAYGNYVTVWRKQPDGTWKVAIDHGTSNPAPPKRVGEGAVATGLPPGTAGLRAGSTVAGSREDAVSELLEADRAFSKASTARNASAAYGKYAAEDIRLLRDDAFPAIGKKAARKALAARPGRLSWHPAAAVVSAAGDFGYTYGASAFRAGAARDLDEPGHYLRVWRRRADGSWSVSVDVMTADPPPPEEPKAAGG
jgi:ketosteroid isomerase-like protein